MIWDVNLIYLLHLLVLFKNSFQDRECRKQFGETYISEHIALLIYSEYKLSGCILNFTILLHLNGFFVPSFMSFFYSGFIGWRISVNYAKYFYYWSSLEMNNKIKINCWANRLCDWVDFFLNFYVSCSLHPGFFFILLHIRRDIVPLKLLIRVNQQNIIICHVQAVIITVNLH